MRIYFRDRPAIVVYVMHYLVTRLGELTTKLRRAGPYCLNI